MAAEEGTTPRRGSACPSIPEKIGRSALLFEASITASVPWTVIVPMHEKAIAPNPLADLPLQPYHEASSEDM
jgi:hypothetical protein